MPEVGVARGVIKVEVLGTEHVYRAIDDANEMLLDSVLHTSEKFLAFMEATCVPRRTLIYHCLNKPWEVGNWRWLAYGWRITKRRIAKHRKVIDGERHAQLYRVMRKEWARDQEVQEA